MEIKVENFICILAIGCLCSVSHEAGGSVDTDLQYSSSGRDIAEAKVGMEDYLAKYIISRKELLRGVLSKSLLGYGNLPEEGSTCDRRCGPFAHLYDPAEAASYAATNICPIECECLPSMIHNAFRCFDRITPPPPETTTEEDPESTVDED